jgi:hypothetical protein
MTKPYQIKTISEFHRFLRFDNFKKDIKRLNKFTERLV